MIAPTYWRLEEAVELARTLQASIRKYGYHLCIGGGVLNTGRSDNDLDLYFLSMDNSSEQVDAAALIAHLESLWGKGIAIGGGPPRIRHGALADDAPLPLTPGAIIEGPLPTRLYPSAPNSPYCAKLMFRYSDLRIDAFVLGGQMAAAPEEIDRASTVSRLVAAARVHAARLAMEDRMRDQVQQAIPLNDAPALSPDPVIWRERLRRPVPRHPGTFFGTSAVANTNPVNFNIRFSTTDGGHTIDP